MTTGTKRLLFILLSMPLLMLMPVAHGETDDAKADDAKADDAKADDANANTSAKANARLTPANANPDKPKPIKIRVPDRLKGQGYDLRIEGESVDLDRKELVLQPTLDQMSIELFDAKGRIVDYRGAFLDSDILEDTYERSWRFAFQLGSAHAPREAPWRQVFLTGNQFQMNAEFGYLWRPLGVTGYLTYQTESSSKSEGFVALYSAVQAGALLHYEFAPFSFAHNYWAKLLVSPVLGVFIAKHALVIADEEVEESDASSNIGFTFGGEVRFPIINNFTLMGRYMVQHQEIDLAGVGFKTTMPHHSLLFGGGYAF